jgi:uncharacterized cupin superfamily protein
MERVRIDDVDEEIDSATVKRPLTDHLGAENLVLNYYELAPGDSFAFGYHEHADQEELFVIQSGTATFETEAGPVRVESGEVIRFAPGEFQRGWNRGEDRVEAIVLGAPAETGESVVLRECPACGEWTSQTFEWSPDRTTKRTLCKDCGTVTGEFE